MRSVWLQMVFERNWRSHWRHRLRKLTDALRGHSCKRICFPPPPFSLADGSRQGACGDRVKTKMSWAMWGRVGSVWRYRVNGNGLSNGMYIDIISLCEIRSLVFQALAPMQFCRPFIDPRNLCGSSQLGTPSYTLILFLHSLSQNRSFSPIPFRCNKSSAVSPYCYRVNLEMDLEAMVVRTWRQ